jgi:hypothetical protein
MNRANALLSKLKSSLPKPTPPPKVRSQGVAVRRSPNEQALLGQAAPAALPEAGSAASAGDRGRGGRVPLCFSVYESDVQRLDEIKDFMRGKGYRNLSNSEALRLACRAVEIGDHFVSVYQQMRREDGRRK